MDNLIDNIIKVDLSGVDVEYLTKGNAVLLLYKDLLNYKSIFEAFGKFDNIILLLPVQSDTQGHWICISQYPTQKVINHWDSYALSWTQEIGYTDNQYVKRNLLGQLYQQAQQQGWTITCNNKRLQQMTTGINSCGRWSCLRARMHYLNNDEFAKLFLNQKMKSDWLITALTFVALNEDETNEEAVIRNLGLNQKNINYKN